jgi:thioredoxin 1
MATKLKKMFQKKERRLNTMIKIYYISAAWCGPCKIFKPIVTQFFEEHAGQIESSILDAEDEIVQQLQVKSVPTIIFFKDNKEVTRVSGVQSKNKLEQLLDEASI